MRAWIGNVKELHEHEKDPARFGLRTAYKLKASSHLYPDGFAKLKVKNAAQLLSESVAAGLESMAKPYFEGTIAFLRFFDELFDSLNSSSLFGCKPSRRALRTPEQFTVRKLPFCSTKAVSKGNFLLENGGKARSFAKLAREN